MLRYVVRPNFRRLGPRLGRKMPLAKKAFAAADGSRLRAQLLETGKGEIDVGGEQIVVEPDDVEVLVEAAEHFAAAGDRTTVVVLNTDIDDKLREEGLYRELLHRVQKPAQGTRRRLYPAHPAVDPMLGAPPAHHLGEPSPPAGRKPSVWKFRHDEPGWDRAERREMKIEDEETTILLVPA